MWAAKTQASELFTAALPRLFPAARTHPCTNMGCLYRTQRPNPQRHDAGPHRVFSDGVSIRNLMDFSYSALIRRSPIVVNNSLSFFFHSYAFLLARQRNSGREVSNSLILPSKHPQQPRQGQEVGTQLPKAGREQQGGRGVELEPTPRPLLGDMGPPKQKPHPGLNH